MVGRRWRTDRYGPGRTQINQKMDFTFFFDPPIRSVQGTLIVQALAPLSMVSAQPGSYFQSAPVPSDAMLIGMIENALGWHLGPADRKAVRKDLRKHAKKAHGKTEWAGSPWLTEDPTGSDSGFVSLLGHHLAFDGLREIPPTMSYDDLWARQAHRADDFWGGSRRYDARVEPIVGMLRSGEVQLAKSKASATHADAESIAEGVQPGDTLFQTALKPQFPYYYVSPTPRGYVVPLGEYRFGASTTPALSEMISAALEEPKAPLYLGSNDGWVDARWEVL